MNIIKFKRDTSFRKQFFVPDSFSHPAKLDAQLQIWLVEHYTEVGETILDPMFGSGTLMLACTLGRNVIGVELEQKFVDMAKANWEKVRMRPQLGSTMGTCEIICGDARQLENILVDKIITSPPYTAFGASREGEKIRTGQSKIHQEKSLPTTYTEEQTDNIGNLSYGQIDKIVTSPPYAEAHDKKIGGLTDTDRPDLIPYSWVKEDNPSNLGNLPYGNIDSIITSPPYEGSLQGDVEDKISSGFNSPQAVKMLEGLARGYSKSNDNIGNLKSTSYLEAMLQVYQQCWNCLKPQGLMILVTKNFIRDQKEVRLDLDTIKLCETAGFTFEERWYRELPAQSFWRVIYKKKYPLAPELKYEDVLIFSK